MIAPSFPLILTAVFDEASAATFQGLRDRHFPADRNIVPAHLTLFHKLPGEEHRAIDRDLRAACGQRPVLPFATAGVRFLGRGVALDIAAAELVALRTSLAASWKPWLGRQDGQGFRPHVTVQNKADPATARALHAALCGAFAPVAGKVVGLALWSYRGGPWDHAGSYPFAG